MISLNQFKEHILAGIKEFSVEIVNEEQNQILRRCFRTVIEDRNSESILNRLLIRINKLKDSDAFLKSVPTQVKETVRPYVNNELTSMLGDFFEPDPDTALDEEDIKEQFKVNLITWMNVMLVRQTGIESKMKNPNDLNAINKVSQFISRL